MASIRALSFGVLAQEYERWRPGYPDAAVDWLSPPAPAQVVDLGAGTGKLTGALIARGLQVEAVEPDPRMLAALEATQPTARGHQSDSTSIPVEDNSVDAVLVADAWHWFDADTTLAEVRRVLVPGGWLGLVWNVVADPVEPWEHDLAGESDQFDRRSKRDPDGIAAQLPHVLAHELELRRFPWTWELTPEHGAAVEATTSMTIALPPADRADRLQARRTELQRVCDSLGVVAVPRRYEASCVRWTPGSEGR